MSHKLQKASLVTIIVLLVVFIPLAGGAIYFKFFNTPEEVILENTNKEFYFDHKLWFYDETSELLGTYPCETANCGYAYNWQSDNDYAIRSLKANENVEIKVINNQYVFLRDFEDTKSHEAFLYDLKNQRSLKEVTYASIKNYGVGITNYNFIVENKDHKYNVMQINNQIEPLFSFDYDFIGLLNSLDEEGLVLADYFVTLKNGMWNIIDQTGAVLTSDFTESIASFNGSYVITKNGSDALHIMDYQAEKVIDEDFKQLSFTDRYLNCTTLMNEFYVYDLASEKRVGDPISIKETDKVETKINTDGNLDVYLNDVKTTTIILI